MQLLKAVLNVSMESYLNAVSAYSTNSELKVAFGIAETLSPDAIAIEGREDEVLPFWLCHKGQFDQLLLVVSEPAVAPYELYTACILRMLCSDLIVTRERSA